MLRVTVQKATNLPDVDFRGKSDPYAKLSFQGVDKKTDHIKDELDPVWNKAFEWDLNGKPLNPDEKLTVVIKDYEKIGFNKVLGKCEVTLRDLVKGKQKQIQETYALKDGKDNPTAATCEIQITYEPPAGAKDESGEGEDGGGGDEGGYGEEGDETEAGEEGEEGGEEGGAPGQPGRPRRKRKRRSRRGKRRWSDKVQDFQIRIKVIEGRQLPGNNIHPLVRVSMSNQKRETQVCRSTNKPVYNESFVFNFHTSEAELFDDMFVIEAFNSKKMRSDALLGYFESDIGSIYEMRGHSFVRKWILLTSPGSEGNDEDEEEAGEEGGKSKTNKSPLGGAPAGYLKVTAMVLGPGDEPPAKAKSTPRDDEEDDIESNCLMPMGVSRQPAVFSVKIYQAEDIPQMDTGMGRSIKKFFKGLFGGGKEEEEQGVKGLVDPYLKMSFCGKKVDTSIKYQDDNPEFKEILQIPLMFPSMCERIKLQIYDWDRVGNDDCIGTAFLSLSAMSGEGDEGFPPTFGPCFVNFYGSPREFSELPDENEALNKGIGEGVAYRGRALVELETAMGSDEIENEVSTIETEDVVRVQPYLRREKFKLFACFYDATMVKDVDGPVEFEVSIGNYGNKMDESVAPANTAPSNPVFDGCHYHYLPWGSEKPCVCVESFWEDIAFRLEPLNLLSKLCDRLEKPLNQIKKALDAPTPPDDKGFVAMVTSLLEHLVSDCMKEQDRFENEILRLPGHRNKLDNKIESLRTEELKYIALEATELKHQLEGPTGEQLEAFVEQQLEIPVEEEEIQRDSIMGELDGFLQRLKDLAIEPQNAIPDVIIWMISGSERIAYYRIPAYEVMHFSNPEACGRLCGNTVELKLKYPGKKASNLKEHPEIPALVRVEMWLGLEKDQDNWTARTKSEGDFVVYAETYENEMKIGPKWFKRGCPRPGFSSADGELELPPDKFIQPEGWKFLGEWEKKPELSIMFDKDAGRKTYVEEIYEQTDRNFPGGSWKQAKVPWTDVGGDESPPKEGVQIPPGWQWTTQWQVDSNRAVDGEGWEYTVDISYGVYSPVQKAYYLSRRRRWVRRRDLKNPDNTKKQAHFQKLLEEGWEYAPIFTMKFHAKERKMDFVRRRRMMRKLMPEGGGKLDPRKTKLPPLLRVQLKSKDAESALIISPRMFVSFPKPHKFQLWAYVYQARDLDACDESGMNDPYVRVAFANQSQVSETKMKTLCPTWDQTLIFNVEIYDSLENIQRHPPSVVMELYDKDQVGKDDFLGRTEFKPLPKMNGIEGPQCKLFWHLITRGEDDAGEILAACELFLDEGAQLPHPPTPRDIQGEILPVRDRVRPVLQKTVVEVLCWGVRNMKKFQLATVKHPSVQFEIGGEIIQSDILTDAKRSPNYGRPILPRKVLNLPVEEMYTPPMNIRVHDNRTFGRKPTVAVHSIKALKRFRIKAPPSPSELQIEVEAPKGPTPPRTPQMGPGQPSGQVPPAQRTTTDGQLIPPAEGEGSGTGGGAQGEGQPEGQGQGMGQRSGSQTIPPSPGPAPRDPKKIPATGEAKKRGPKKTPEERAKEPEERFDWWSKYHASLAGEEVAPQRAKKLLALLSPDESDSNVHITKYRELGYDHLTVYPKELERVDTFGGFQDVIASFPLHRGKKKKKKSDDDDEPQKVVGEFKGSFRIYPMPEHEGGEAELPETMFTNLPQSEPIECLVRVYIISATDLQPQDPSGLADPYVVVQLGKKKQDTKDNYKPNTLNPVFGKMFEFDVVIPLHKDLKVTIMDYDLLSRDDMIGETMIDLEQRLFSHYYAKCGLPKTYCDSGPNQWRDHKRPMELLKEWCDRNDKNFKFYKGTKDGTPDRIVVAYRVYQLDEFESFHEDDKPNNHLGIKHQRLALHVLNQLQMVPEHVETRALKSNIQPNIEQGKIQMWVDVFPRNEGGILKSSVDVTAREPTDYSLRCIIWNTADVIMEETSITGEQMSDIYVKTWLDREADDKQKTDVHYRSMDGDGNFNWRMVFPFLYLPIEKKMVIRKKEHFWSLDYKEERTVPRLLIQIWENDTFSFDDFLGKVELDLVKLPKPCGSSKRCGSSRDPGKNGEHVDLFQQKSIQGWWACYQEGNDKPTGKVEMTLELLTSGESAAKPVGLGREEPNQHPHLDEPNRPATSFLWFMSPFKTLKYIIWRNYKWYIIGFLVLLIVLAIVVIFVYSLPGYTAKKMLGV